MKTTNIGKLIEVKYDEIPQFINVLKGNVWDQDLCLK